MKNSINIFAPLRNHTGYAEVVRNLVRRLYFLGWKINFSEFKHWSGVATPLSDADEKLFKSLEANQYPSEKLLSFCLPEQCAYAEDKTNILYTMFEASRDLPKLWADSSEKIDYIIVPTVHNYRLWDMAIKTSWGKIHQVPLGVDPLEADRASTMSVLDNETGKDIALQYPYRILVLQEFISRKNLRGVLEAFFEGCHANPVRFDDTCLVLKINSNSGSRLTKFIDLIRGIRERMESKYDCKFPRNVFAYTRYVEESQLYSFINSFTHYFSMSLGEGWDLTAIKAASLGKQLIVPANTSYLEYLDETKAHLIPCTEDTFEIEEQTLSRIYGRSLWTIPNTQEAADRIADLDKLPKLDATSVKSDYSWDVSALALSKKLEELSYFSDRNMFPGVKLAEEEDDDEGFNLCKKFVNNEKTYLMNCKSLGQHCGIGEFSKTLHTFFAAGNHKMITFAGDLQTAIVKAEAFRPSVFHLQDEYQFFHLQRLKMMVKSMRERNIKLFLTQHTYNSAPFEYNDFFIRSFDKVIVHNNKIVSAYVHDFGQRAAEKVVYMPMPVERKKDLPTVPEMEKAMNFDPQSLNLGFFGFCYYHKGVDRLLISFKEAVAHLDQEQRKLVRLYIFSSKPKQDNLGYYEQCLNILSQLGINSQVFWISNYLPQNTLVYGLRLLDYIFLPYDDYGSVAASAALTTCVQAERPIIYCSTDSPCFDIEPQYAANIRQFKNSELAEKMGHIVEQFCRSAGKKEASIPSVWDQYFAVHTWEEVVRRHVELYEG